MNIAEIHTA